MTTTIYGTFPVATTAAAINNRALRQQIIRSGLLESRRPWKQMLSFSIPKSFADSLTRLTTNISYFYTNYILFLFFLCLVFRPVPLFVFILVKLAWLFFYFLRDDPVCILGYVVDERVVLAWLSIFTVAILFVTVTVKVVVALVVGVVVVVVHGVFRRIDDGIIMVRDCEDNNGGGEGSSWPSPNVNLKGNNNNNIINASLSSSRSSSFCYN